MRDNWLRRVLEGCMDVAAGQSENQNYIVFFSMKCYDIRDGYTVRPNAKRQLQDADSAGISDGSAVLQARCDRNARISGEQTRSMADNLLQKTAKTATAGRKR